MKEIILASASPRRKEILGLFIKDFTVFSADADETVPGTMPPQDVVSTLAARKARAVAEIYPDAVVIGADTVVFSHGEILGKPKDRNDAKRMLSALSGGEHSVFSGVCVIAGGREYTGYEETRVKMRALDESEIKNYVNSGECDDKAGSYGIQGRACAFISGIDGSFHNVMGLPIYTLAALMKDAGYPLL